MAGNGMSHVGKKPPDHPTHAHTGSTTTFGPFGKPPKALDVTQRHLLSPRFLSILRGRNMKKIWWRHGRLRGRLGYWGN